MVDKKHKKSSRIMYEKSDCVVCARVPAIPITSSERDHLSRNENQKSVRRVHNIQEQLR